MLSKSVDKMALNVYTLTALGFIRANPVDSSAGAFFTLKTLKNKKPPLI